MSAAKPTHDATAFVPGFLFFYGSLQDEDVLKQVTKSSIPPVMRKGWIEGFQVKMWGIYPTLVPCEGGRVDGMFWRVEDLQAFARLQYYETDAYRPCPCTIYSQDGKAHNGATFCWAGEADSMELDEGSFDLERYRKYFKPSMFK